jgi:hypothetical protein
VRNLISTLVLLLAATAGFAGVTVTAPTPGSTLGSPVHFVASASGSTTIASMIVYIDGVEKYRTYSNRVDTYISMAAGGHTATISAWDNWGGFYTQNVWFSASGSSVGVTITAPGNLATTGNPVHFVASARGSTTIASMIIYVDLVQKYLVYAPSLDTYLTLPAGAHQILIKAWDQWGGIYQQGEAITVGTGSSGGGVSVSSPAPGSTVGSPAHFVASASPSGSAPIASMIVYIDNVQKYLVYSNQLDTQIAASAGTHSAIVKAWDNNGTIYQNTFNFTVSGSTSTSTSGGGSSVTAGTTVYNVQSQGGWGSCTVCAGLGGTGPVAGYAMQQYQSSPSLSGSSAKYSIWGSTPYADVLWWKQIIDGDAYPSANSAPHHYIYDAYFYINNPSAAQALEFDINHFVNGHSLIFGTQCNIRSGGVWDIWDNQRSAWVHTSKPCPAPSAYTWHHVTLQMERASDGGDWLHYISITMDGNTTYLNAWYPPASTSWKGVTVNFQMDGNYAMQPYSVWLDKLAFSYY